MFGRFIIWYLKNFVRLPSQFLDKIFRRVDASFEFRETPLKERFLNFILSYYSLIHNTVSTTSPYQIYDNKVL